MKRKSTYRTICGLASCVLASLVIINEAQADGTEQLGTPSIPIAPGSYVLVEGTGLLNSQPADINIEIPSDVSIAQVLLYWNGTASIEHAAEDTIEVNSNVVTGSLIGASGPNLGTSADSGTYRVDITEMSSNLNWIVAGQTNVLSVGGLDFDRHNNGAALMVILDDGSMADIQIMDGDDSAYLTHGYQTEPVDFPVALSTSSQTGTLWLVVSDIDIPRPAAVDVTINGITTRLDDVFLVNEGDFLSVVELEVPLSAGVSNVTVQVLSIDDETELDPASLVWMCAAWQLHEPYNPPEGCTYTIGYWKNHPYDWPTEELSLYSKYDAMNILWTPPKKGNAYLILAHQYIGAELNVVNGTSIPDEVLEAWLSAQELLETYMDDGVIPKKSSDRGLAIYLASMLDDYNNGLLGPGHCD